MANSVLTRNRRGYITASSTYGTAVAPTNSDAARYIGMDFKPVQNEDIRPDINSTLSAPLGTLMRKSCAFTGSASMAGSGTAGTSPDLHPILRALFGATSTSAGVSNTYSPDDPALYIDQWQYVSPSTGEHEAAISGLINQGTFNFGGNFGTFDWSGEAKLYISSGSLTSLDTEGKGGLSSWPTEPASPSLNGSAVQGYKGTLTLDGNVYTTGRQGKIAFNANRTLYHDNWGSDYGAAGAGDRRSVMTDISMYDDDSANLTSLKLKAILGTTVALSFVVGITAGNIWSFTMPRVRLSKPVYSYQATRRIVDFSGCVCHPTTDATKDELTLVIT